MNVFLVGIFSASSLVLGGLIGSFFNIRDRFLGLVMAFGAGSLFSAVAYELALEANKTAGGTGFPIAGLFVGALTFFATDRWIEKISPKGGAESGNAKLIIPMVLAIVMDGIPESIILGLGIYEKGTVSLSMLMAVFVSNIPEAIAGTTGMKASGWRLSKILSLWIGIAIVCGLSTVAGHLFFSHASIQWLSFIQAFAGGAILVMLANSMIPESYEHAGKLAGIFVVMGFALAASVVVLESA